MQTIFVISAIWHLNKAADDPDNPPEMQRMVDDGCVGKNTPEPTIEVMADKAVVKKRSTQRWYDEF